VDFLVKMSYLGHSHLHSLSLCQSSLRDVPLLSQL